MVFYKHATSAIIPYTNFSIRCCQKWDPNKPSYRIAEVYLLFVLVPYNIGDKSSNDSSPVYGEKRYPRRSIT